MARKIDDIKVHCAERLRCRGNRVGVSGGLITDIIHICYEKMEDLHYAFCDLAGVVAHEYGHMIGMPRALFGGHNDGDIDATRMFGWFVKDLCRQDNLDRSLDDFATPLLPNPHVPTSGILLFPDPDFQGRGRHFTTEFLDLRHIGRNDAVSSLQVLSGVWELCEHQEFRGWCHVFSHDEPRLADLRVNDAVSSLRPITLLRQGMTVFQHPTFEGGSQNFTAAIADLSEVGINDAISSLQIHAGRWEVCEDPHFRRCVFVEGDAPDLKPLGLNDEISSVRPVPSTGFFPQPTIDGSRLDLCREWGSNCGEPAATAFCQAQGYEAVADWGSDPDIGAQYPTQVIGTGEICDQSFCDGFTHIACM
jgi:hypothetical protein